ncbi:hypothetical protein ALC56_03896 [Trachymyrmex septentrionalis]|uniref:Uncharacterized protein n=1 Tax=Trachymyrmex septentrionalis TaxID=34720 RepID=A0A151JZU7_9HYME|nr:hypothetical protein ALC56_03896 [Trachymyrmex septentrionalis]
MKSMVAYSSIVHMNLMMSIFYIVNLYYMRSGRRLLFLNKGMVGNLPSIVCVIW